MRIFLLVGLLCLAGVARAQEENSKTKKIEKIRARAEAKKRKLDSLRNNLLKVNTAIQVDSLTALPAKDNIAYFTASDSLYRINQLPSDGEANPLGSIPADSSIKSLKRLSDNLQKRADSIGGKLFDKVGRLEPNASDKIQEDITRKQLPIPELDESGLQLPDNLLPHADPKLNLHLRGKQLPQLNPSLPATPAITDPTLPVLAVPGLNLPNGALNELQNLQSIDSLSPSDLTKLPVGIGVDSAKIRELLDLDVNLNPYRKELDSLSGDDLLAMGMNEVEAYANNTEAVTELSEEMKKVNAIKAEQEARLQRYRDKKLLVADITRKSANVANEIINPFSNEFKQAQNVIAKARKRNPVVENVKELVRKRPNEMKAKPFYERLVPGIGLQPFHNTNFSVDLAPFIGYRFTGRWSAGLGGVYRMAFSTSNRYYVKEGGVYGLRSYADFTLFKGFFAHSKLEWLHLGNSIIPPAERELQQHTWNLSLGIGKQVPLNRKINTTITTFYRFEMQGYLPGATQIGIGMAFIYVTKKMRKPTALE